jgi:hypothetical protein
LDDKKIIMQNVLNDLFRKFLQYAFSQLYFNYAGTVSKTMRMTYLGNFYNISQTFRKHFANIPRLHFNYAGTVSKT